MVLPLGKTNDERSIIKKCLQVRDNLAFEAFLNRVF